MLLILTSSLSLSPIDIKIETGDSTARMDRYHSGHSGSIAVSTGSAQGYGRGGDISLEGGTSRVRLGRRCWNNFLCTYIDTLIPFICIKQHDDGGDVKIKAGTGKNIGLSTAVVLFIVRS